MVTTTLSLTGKRWHLPDTAMDISEFVGTRLQALETDSSALWDDPTLFPAMEKATARVREALSRGEQILIFGDYDCDGITASAQVLRCLRRHGGDPLLRLPHRIHDGYGLRPKHIDEAADQHVSLIITVDTGVSAHDALARAAEKQIDVIILDHHHLTTPPQAFAVIHPALAPGYAPPHPSAAGIAFLFVTAMENGPWADRDTDLALALFGTVADLVPLSGKNRQLVQDGLRALTRLPEGPVRLLVESVANAKALTASDIAFRIAPRINAAGRMDDPTIALHALLDGGAPLQQLETLNTNRQEETVRCIDHALRDLHDDVPAFIAVGDTSYTPGIIGLIAGKLTERFGRPSMAVHINGNTCTGSLRSPACYNIVEGLERIAHLLTDFGGHAQAAGCSFPLEHLAIIQSTLNADVQDRTDAAQLVPGLHIDAVVDPEIINTRMVLALQTLEPYGQGNSEPLFLLPGATLTNVRRVGSDGKHLSAMVGRTKLIGFGMGDFASDVYKPVDLVCRIGMDTWNGKISPQLFLVDARMI